jgi:hypothetical protein
VRDADGLYAQALSAEVGRGVPSSNVLAVPMAVRRWAGFSASAAGALITTTSLWQIQETSPVLSLGCGHERGDSNSWG